MIELVESVNHMAAIDFGGGTVTRCAGVAVDMVVSETSLSEKFDV
jgi:hypothetical protein